MEVKDLINQQSFNSTAVVDLAVIWAREQRLLDKYSDDAKLIVDKCCEAIVQNNRAHTAIGLKVFKEAYMWFAKG